MAPPLRGTRTTWRHYLLRRGVDAVGAWPAASWGNGHMYRVRAGRGPPIVQRSRRATRAHLRAWGRRRRRRPDDLMQAARNDDAEAIGRALRAGVDPNTKDGETGRTLAIEAARHGAVNALALLLAATEGAEEQRTESSVTARGGDGGWFV